MRLDRRELRLIERSGGGRGPLEWFVKGVSEPLHFNLSESWELFEPSC